MINNTKTCGEIICQNQQEFFINCKLCKIKIFDFKEFILHIKNVHLLWEKEEKHKDSNKTVAQEEEIEDNNKRILNLNKKSRNTKKETRFKEENVEDFEEDLDNDFYHTNDEDDKDFELDEKEEKETEDEDQDKSIIRKVI